MTDLDLGGLSLEEAEREIYAHIVSRNPEHDFEPTLDRVRDACDLLGSPQHAYKVVHLTGTNGKTSTARMTEALVREHGLRTGLFTSPHLTTVRERIMIDGEPIPREDFVRLWQEIAPILALVDARSAEAGGPRMSFFEVLVVLAFAAFADAPVDVAVVEVGMGGVWDATNVADGDVAVVTPVGLDHQEWLGDSLVDIAAEKSGIIKDGAAAVIAAQAESVAPVLAHAVEEHAARGYWEGEALEVVDRQPGVGGQLVTLRTPAAVYAELFVPLYGEYQAHNALLALAATELLLADGGEPASLAGETVEAGFASVTSPGRLEAVRTSPLILVDAAHNPHGAEALVGAVEESFAFTTLVGVVGILRDKDAEGVLGALEPALDHVVITASSSPRAIPVDELAAIARDVFGEDRVTEASSLPDAIDAAVQRAERDDDLGAGVLVVGSITLVADARILTGADRRKGVGRAR
ncbi:folylpolyglutamate synthase/dihydrofolate synthase family protein [Demequina sp. SYSU T00039]|uniref:tetrahydrofolate synthase n=1 Tax=Demequina lignilytica TaxID=3051663 RepID=A0AAW7M2C5_9MICO|nr:MULTISPECIES: folylpolyglutamate synthase/dihydrofolate synthase family protein [unclassified Demequina]MDN4477234.1 folylpolyglutamate synthase/dihydrofolate synthase family protein [Demequina sp. SYSU T00039-1]MDN4487407.1 folylpolyglutamate synthase/dihydrofolate synthase family protein [Demequina sp. SYSU T00039]MDN4491160.1 folylpolyglutamate synthase/dihydrofolate synthase family protein [Demequina sp. SYSU T00068]